MLGKKVKIKYRMVSGESFGEQSAHNKVESIETLSAAPGPSQKTETFIGTYTMTAINMSSKERFLRITLAEYKGKEFFLSYDEAVKYGFVKPKEKGNPELSHEDKIGKQVKLICSPAEGTNKYLVQGFEILGAAGSSAMTKPAEGKSPAERRPALPAIPSARPRPPM